MRGSFTACCVVSLGLALPSGCSSPGDTADADRDNEFIGCEGVSQSALTPVDRKIVGVAAPYPADGTLRARDAELSASQSKRREVAWATVAKVLSTVPLAEDLPNGAGLPHRIPAWQTWYGLDDLRRVFHHLYEPLSVDDKANRTRLKAADLDDAFLWNTTAVDELPTWPAERYLAYLDAIDASGKVAGLGGIARVSYSPAAASHLLQSYPEILACRESGAPKANATGPLVKTNVARVAVAAAACERSGVGTYAIGEEETLQAVLESDGAAPDAVLIMRAGDKECVVAPGATCKLSGPAEVDVAVSAGAAQLRSVVALDRTSDRPEWSACLDGAFPIDAVVVKADYRRADLEMTMPVYSTSAAALAKRLSGDFTWELADGEADPPPSDIYTLTLPNGTHYRLAALHIMTKELDHWQWITLWWSDAPNTDFGADRPSSGFDLNGPWSNYKMCVTTAFEEGDPASDGGFKGEHPTLSDALEVTYEGIGTPTWCSNPYIELGHQNAGTNCIGCHQHGGTQLVSEDILTFDERGRTQLRNNFPSDYSWATTSGDNLGQLFADEELFFLGPQ